MKKRFLALSLAVATVITVLSVGIFASNILRSSDTQLTDADTGPVIVAGYNDGTNITVNSYYNSLGGDENWVLPGRLTDNSGNVTGTFGAQWNEEYLYIAIQRSSSSDTVTLKLNNVNIDTPSQLGNTFELSVPISQLSLGTIDRYNVEVPISISLSSGGSFSGKLKLSSVEWWLTSNVSNPITASLSTPTGMREYDISAAFDRKDIGRENIDSHVEVDGETITNGLHLWDKYNESEGVTNYMGTKTQATYGGDPTKITGYENMGNRDKTVYFSFDFRAEKMPVYELGESLGSYHTSPYYSNFGFTWHMADDPVAFTYDDEKTATYSNVSMGGIVNTGDEEGLYLIIAGRQYNTLKLDKFKGETFNVGLAWHSNGDLSVYIDGVLKAYYTDTTKRVLNTNNHVVAQGVRLMCRRNELPRERGDDFDLYITNLAFGSALPDAPVKALSFKDIQGDPVVNTSAEAVTGDLELPNTLNADSLFNESITWESSNPDVISDDVATLGKVNRSKVDGAEKVTLTATDDADNKKTIDVIVLGTNYSSDKVFVVEGDTTPSNIDGKKPAVEYTEGVFHFDSNNNSLVYVQNADKPVNVIKLTDLDEVSRLNRETISIWTSDTGETYTRLEQNYKLLHVGKDWYLYNFDVTARYIKVNYTLSDELYATDMDSLDDVQMDRTYTMYDGAESDFANVLSNIMTVYYEDVFGAEDGKFTEKNVTVTNYSGKKQQDYAWRISRNDLQEVTDLTKVRVKLDNEYLYHYVDGDNLYVRIPDVENGQTVTLTVLYSNDENVIDTSDKESVYEVTYGTKEMYIDLNQRFMFALEKDTELRDLGSDDKPLTLKTDVLLENEGYRFNLSYDGGQNWELSDPFRNDFTVNNNGGYIFYEGRLYWRTHSDTGLVITFSDDGGKTWSTPKPVDYPVINGEPITVSSYANGISPSCADGGGDDSPNVDLIYPLSGYLEDGDMANVFLVSYNDGESWEYAKNKDGKLVCLYTETEQKSEGGLSEATILENEDNQLVWYCRYQTNAVSHFAISVSDDYGLTWSGTVKSSDDGKILIEPVESTVYGTNTQPIMAKIDNDPLFIWGGNNAFGGHSFNRGPLNVAVSYDGLYTFRNIQNVFTETYFEDYTQTKFCAYITNPSVVKSGEDLIIAYYTNRPKYKVFTRITDYENWFYRTKGIYDSFESQNTKYEGWVPFMGGTSITNDTKYGKYALEIAPHGVVSRSVPYLQNGTVSMNVYVDGESTFTIELQSAFTPVMNRCAPVSLEVQGNALYANGYETGLELETNKWNSISIDLGLAKKTPTASVSVNGENADFDPNVVVEGVGKDGVGYNDYVCYIVVNTGKESVSVDEVLVQSNLDAINYNGKIPDEEIKITADPTDLEMVCGETATFEVGAEGGYYNLMYQWYVCKDGDSNWTAIEGATSATYTTETLLPEQNRSKYKCIVMDRNENTLESNVATLIVDNVSVTIQWGSMAFNCYGDDNVWKPVAEGADEITVINESEVDLIAIVTYQPVEDYESINGSFGDAEVTLTAETGTVTWTLTLSGEGDKELKNTPIGQVIIRIDKAS